MAVQDNPPVRRDPVLSETPRQPGVVGQDGTGSDQDGVELLAQEQGALPSFRTGDPAALPARGRDPAVETARPLGQNEGAALLDPDEESLVLEFRPPSLLRCRREDPDSAPPEGRESGSSRRHRSSDGGRNS